MGGLEATVGGCRTQAETWSCSVTMCNRNVLESGMKNKILVVSLLVCCSTALQARDVSNAPQWVDYPDAKAIREARNIQTQALADEDVELVASFWTEDLTVRRALGHIIASKEEAVAVIQPTGDPATRVIFQRKSTKIKVSDNWPLAYEEGEWTGHKGGVDGPVIVSGSYGAQWVKRNGEWFIRSEVFVALDCKDSGCDYQALP